MTTYIGTKVVKAIPMNRADYNDYRNWPMPSDENGNDEGMLVEYLDGGQPNDSRHSGYISWSPIEVFNKAYRPTTGMTFGQAIEALKVGKRVARAGWNSKGMWLVLVPGTPLVSIAEGTPYYKAGIRETRIRPHIDMWTVNAEGHRAMLPGWLASQTDMLSEDWEVVL